MLKSHYARTEVALVEGPRVAAIVLGLLLAVYPSSCLSTPSFDTGRETPAVVSLRPNGEKIKPGQKAGYPNKKTEAGGLSLKEKWY